LEGHLFQLHSAFSIGGDLGMEVAPINPLF